MLCLQLPVQVVVVNVIFILNPLVLIQLYRSICNMAPSLSDLISRSLCFSVRWLELGSQHDTLVLYFVLAPDRIQGVPIILVKLMLTVVF